MNRYIGHEYVDFSYSPPKYQAEFITTLYFPHNWSYHGYDYDIGDSWIVAGDREWRLTKEQAWKLINGEKRRIYDKCHQAIADSLD